MKPFETYIANGGELTVNVYEPDDMFTLDSKRGQEFGAYLIDEVKKHYPHLIDAVEQKIKLTNKAVFNAMKTDRRVYVARISHTICSCCFGELSETRDFDGETFHMEYPRQCRDLKFCPWNGYAERNKDSKLVICGARRDFGLSPQELRCARMVQKGYTSNDILADVMCVSKDCIHKYLNKIYTKTGMSGMANLVNLLKDIRI